MSPPIDSDSSDDADKRRSKKKKVKHSVCKKGEKTKNSKSRNNNNIDDDSAENDPDDSMGVVAAEGSGGGGGGGGEPPNNSNDPPQNSASFRRHVRNQYRDVLEDLQVNAKEYADQGNFNIMEKLLEVDKLYNSVTQTREAAMDSSTIAHIAMLSKQKAQSLKTDMFIFGATDFAERLVVFTGAKRGEGGVPEAEWKPLGRKVAEYFKTAPSYSCMLGTFERTQYVGKEKAVRQRNKADKEDFVKNKTKVTEMDKVESTNEETTARMTEHVHTQLKRYYKNEEPIDYFEFVCDPDSFGRTIENIFYLSFLVREGMAKVSLDEEKLPVIEPTERQVDKDGNPVVTNTRLFNQVAVSLTYPQWRQIVEVYERDIAIIKRPENMETGKGKGSTSSSKHD